MADTDHGPNDGFFEDATFVSNDGDRRRELAEIMRTIIGRAGDRSRAFGKIKLFIDDFNINPSLDTSGKGSDILTNLIRDMVHNNVKWPIAPFLAWMSFYHKEKALEFYKKVNLSNQIGYGCRRYVGNPGDAGRDRRSRSAVTKRTTATHNDLRDKVLSSLRELMRIERQLAKLRYVISDATSAAHLVAAKIDHCARVDSYLATHNDPSVIDALSDLYEVGHWADQKAHDSQSLYNPTAFLALARADDRSSPSFVRLALNLVNNCKKIGNKAEEGRAYNHILGMDEIKRKSEFSSTAVFRADYLLNNNSQMTAHEVCDTFLRDPSSSRNAVAKASVWRCQACVALKTGQFDKVVESISTSRQLLKVSKLVATDEKMIPVYLDAIEVIFDYRVNRAMSGDLVNRIYGILDRIRQIEPQSLPLTIVLYDTLAEIFTSTGRTDGDKAGSLRDGALSATLTISRLLPSSIKDCCLFDMAAIQARIADEMDRLGLPPSDPFPG